MDAKLTGKIINEKRKALGLTQKELAEKLNVSNRTVSKWETGDGFPDISILPELAECLDISIDELLTGIKPKPIVVEEAPKENTKKHRAKFITAEIIAFALAFAANAIGSITELKLFRMPPFYVFIEIYLLVLSVLLFVTAVIVFFTAFVKYKYESENKEKTVKYEIWAFSAFSLIMPVITVLRFLYYYIILR